MYINHAQSVVYILVYVDTRLHLFHVVLESFSPFPPLSSFFRFFVHIHDLRATNTFVRIRMKNLFLEAFIFKKNV